MNNQQLSDRVLASAVETRLARWYGKASRRSFLSTLTRLSGLAVAAKMFPFFVPTAHAGTHGNLSGTGNRAMPSGQERFQAILYDTATGAVRQVLDPEKDLSPEAVCALVNPGPHEAVIAHPKQPGRNQHSWCDWQMTVTRSTGKLPAGLRPQIEAHIREELQL